jgi:hypothetical protein
MNGILYKTVGLQGENRAGCNQVLNRMLLHCFICHFNTDKPRIHSLKNVHFTTYVVAIGIRVIAFPTNYTCTYYVDRDTAIHRPIVGFIQFLGQLCAYASTPVWPSVAKDMHYSTF